MPRAFTDIDSLLLAASQEGYLQVRNALERKGKGPDPQQQRTVLHAQAFILKRVRDVLSPDTPAHQVVQALADLSGYGRSPDEHLG